MIDLYVGNIEQTIEYFSASQRQRLLSLICVERRKKIEKLSIESKRKCSLLAGIMLEQIGRQYIQMITDSSPDKLEIGYGEHGKPYFINYPSVHFNLTHSGPFVVLGIGDRPLGIDLEERKDAKEAVAKRCFHEEEYKKLLEKKEYSLEEYNEWFYLCWTMKEAYLKYKGDGLTKPLSKLNMNPDNGTVDGDDSVKFSFPRLQDGVVLTSCCEKDQAVTIRIYKREEIEKAFDL